MAERTLEKRIKMLKDKSHGEYGRGKWKEIKDFSL